MSASKRGRMAKNKGKVGEREFASLLTELGVPARRGVQFAGGQDSPDVVHALPGIHFEVKRTEQLNLFDALAQATVDTRGTTDFPIVAHRKNRRPWVVIMYADQFIELLKEVKYV